MSIDSIKTALNSVASISASNTASQGSSTSFESYLSPGLTAGPAVPDTTASYTPKVDPAVTNFMNYMKESPAQRYMDSWLSAHHLTEEDLKEMTPEKREAIMKEIAQDMKTSVENDVTKKTGSLLSLSNSASST